MSIRIQPPSWCITRSGIVLLAASASTNAFQQRPGKCYSSNLALSGGSTTPDRNRTWARGTAVLSMATAMAFHFFAYSLARPTTLALFTSSKVGFQRSSSAFPLAMALVSPLSLFLLLFYNKILNSNNGGPRMALRYTTVLCSAVITFTSFSLSLLSTTGPTATTTTTKSIVTKVLVGFLYVFRESYVQLLTSQYWSFLTSVLTPQQGSAFVAPIAGLTSLSSALAGMSIPTLVEWMGLTGVLEMAGIFLVTSLIFTDLAYKISEQNGFSPVRSHSSSGMKQQGSVTHARVDRNKHQTMIVKALDLFARVPVLKALFIEILACQGLSTLLNICFVTKLSNSIPDDVKRAGWMGKFFALVNAISGVLQFGVLPPLMRYMEPSALWRILPMGTLILSFYHSSVADASLVLVSGAFLLQKTTEFSVRRMLDELVYIPLDFESRFLGKEIISVFGYRFGKSGMSFALSMVTSIFGNVNVSYLTTSAAFLWLWSAWNLSNLIPTRAEADLAYTKERRPHKQTLLS